MNTGRTIDWSGPDYQGVEWFKDPTPNRDTHASSSPIPGSDAIEPSAEMVARNEALAFAVRASPSILYERYKQFGQLGVLGWCDEFSELVDDIKALAFEGNMFISTRDQALEACEQILRVNVDVKMQLIILFLSSQVARLRRILDEERDFDDYPDPSFPLPPP